MSTVTFNGNAINVDGHFPHPGETAPGFTLVDSQLNDVSLRQFSGQRKILNIVPSLDTAICAESTRKFNAAAGALPNTAVIVISADLPFAQGRFCAQENLAHITALSTMRGRKFHQDYGVMITDHPLAGLTARAVIVLDENDRVLHSELVPEIGREPDYDAALAALRH